MPDTVSPELRPRIAAPYPPGWDAAPQAAAAWKELAAGSAAAAAPDIKAIRERLAIRVEQSQIAGVKVFLVTPSELAPENPTAHRGVMPAPRAPVRRARRC